MKRDSYIQFRVSAERKDRLKAMARQRQVGLSELVRQGLIAIHYGSEARTAAVHKEMRALRSDVAALKAELQAERNRSGSLNRTRPDSQTVAISRQVMGIERKLDELLRQAGGHR